MVLNGLSPLRAIRNNLVTTVCVCSTAVGVYFAKSSLNGPIALPFTVGLGGAMVLARAAGHLYRRRESKTLKSKRHNSVWAPAEGSTDFRYAVQPIRSHEFAVLSPRAELRGKANVPSKLDSFQTQITAVGGPFGEVRMACTLVDATPAGGAVLCDAPLPAGQLIKLDLPNLPLLAEVRSCDSLLSTNRLSVKFLARIERSKVRSFITHRVPAVA